MKYTMNLIFMCSVLALGIAGVNKFNSISKDKNIFTDRQATIMAQADFN